MLLLSRFRWFFSMLNVYAVLKTNLNRTQSHRSYLCVSIVECVVVINNEYNECQSPVVLCINEKLIMNIRAICVYIFCVSVFFIHRKQLKSYHRLKDIGDLFFRAAFFFSSSTFFLWLTLLCACFYAIILLGKMFTEKSGSFHFSVFFFCRFSFLYLFVKNASLKNLNRISISIQKSLIVPS